jgi:hypothetical protein
LEAIRWLRWGRTYDCCAIKPFISCTRIGELAQPRKSAGLSFPDFLLPGGLRGRTRRSETSENGFTFFSLCCGIFTSFLKPSAKSLVFAEEINDCILSKPGKHQPSIEQKEKGLTWRSM